MFDKILESLDAPQTSRAPPTNWRQAPDTSRFVLNRKRSAQPHNDSLASMQAQLINNHNHYNFYNYVRHSRPPPENTPQNNQRRAFNSLENLQMINSVMQDPQAKKNSWSRALASHFLSTSRLKKARWPRKLWQTLPWISAWDRHRRVFRAGLRTVWAGTKYTVRSNSRTRTSNSSSQGLWPWPALQSSSRIL
jgi:hypothetical protein